MTALDSLEAEARQAAVRRGHDLSHWREDREQPARASAQASCLKPDCTAWVQVQVAPPPNGIDIGGPAVALNCPSQS